MIALVVAAAILGDSAGFEIGHRYGPRILTLPAFARHQRQLTDAQRLLARRGGGAVFLGRFVAFFRALMPALAGIAHMPYRRFLLFNAAGGLVWGIGAVVPGFLAGNSYKAVERTAGSSRTHPRHRMTAVAAERAGGLAADPAEAERADAELAQTVTTRDALQIGSSQILALFAGISRSGITMVTGLWRGLDHEQAARFAFLLATPVILAAGVLKLPILAGSAGDGIRGQVLVGSIAAGLAAYLSVRFLTRYFQTRTLTPFAIYCLVVGIACIARFA
jgi:undecaprenyl-diphosphatase